MKRKLIASVTLIMSLLLIFSGVSFAISPEQQAKIAAEEGFPQMLDTIEICYKDFHYDQQDEVKNSYIGDPIYNYKLSEKTFSKNDNITNQIKIIPFYVFPVMSNGKIITDLTVVLENQKWKVVDIGGHISKVIYQQEHQYNLSKSKIVRAFGKTVVIAEQGNNLVGYLPYYGDITNGIAKCEIISAEKLMDYVDTQKQISNKYAKLNANIKNLAAGYSGNQGTPNLEFKQGSILERLSTYMHYLARNAVHG